MLVVKPNPRRMRAFLNSPAEGSLPLPGRAGILQRVRWQRALLAVGAIAAAAGVVLALAVH